MLNDAVAQLQGCSEVVEPAKIGYNEMNFKFSCKPPPYRATGKLISLIWQATHEHIEITVNYKRIGLTNNVNPWFHIVFVASTLSTELDITCIHIY